MLDSAAVKRPLSQEMNRTGSAGNSSLRTMVRLEVIRKTRFERLSNNCPANSCLDNPKIANEEAKSSAADVLELSIVQK